MGMTGFDRRIKLSFVCRPRLDIFLVNHDAQDINANVISRVKNALVNAFSVPSFASVVA